MDRDKEVAAAIAEVRAARGATARPALWLRLLIGVWHGIAAAVRFLVEFLAELLGEFVLGMLAVGLFVGLLAAIGWGLVTAPLPTAVLVAALLVFLGLAVRETFFGAKRGRTRPILGGVGLATALWASYVLMYYVN
ncbi:hypothetical protein [Actinokineospora globicatena]|uniref:hypothetical protein n=1 Tax=Actinokineospora globicatena TaxID=103729 RepID=UPI0020A578E1|nr:hypothetical protein [Actinokineospora globicatena]